MTIDELKDLIDRAEMVTGRKIQLTRNPKGAWSTWTDNPDDEANDRWDATLEECIASLKKWATPKKPETITVTVSYYAAENAAREHCSFSSAVRTAFKEALKPYETKGE